MCDEHIPDSVILKIQASLMAAKFSDLELDENIAKNDLIGEIFREEKQKRREARMSPGGGESPAGSQEENQSSVGTNVSTKPGDNREVGDTR